MASASGAADPGGAGDVGDPGGAGGVGGAGAARRRPELCAGLLLLCWLCCWPDHSDESRPRRCSRAPLGRGRAASLHLHLPGTSGSSSGSGAKQPLSAHRSHEEIRRRKSQLDDAARYHSAPSVIHEVLHRRHWQRSSKDLYIPLNPQNELATKTEGSPEVSHRWERSSKDLYIPLNPQNECTNESEESLAPSERGSSEGLDEARKCKKHHKNIKSSKNKCKESNKDDIKDTDATEIVPNFYIGEESLPNNETDVSEMADGRVGDESNKWIYKGKGDKQSLNESIKQQARSPPSDRSGARPAAGILTRSPPPDRSGARPAAGSRARSRGSLAAPTPPPSVEAADYSSGAVYLQEPPPPPLPHIRSVVCMSRARHASDGDILAPHLRPESGAFSESDLDIDLEASEERPPDYCELRRAQLGGETAI